MKTKSIDWFKKRIGKRIYRDTLSPCCPDCDEVAKNGLVIFDEMHAESLFHTEIDFASEGIFCNYRETP
jgi:hypothetical protein